MRGGEKGEGSGSWGCEYFNGCIREKYFAISSVEGGGSRIFPESSFFLSVVVSSEVAVVTEAFPDKVVDDADKSVLEIAVEGRNVAASGAEAYRSCIRDRPKEITGLVA